MLDDSPASAPDSPRPAPDSPRPGTGIPLAPGGGRPVWAEVSLGRLAANYRTLAALAADAELLAVVKADAYGHGAALCAPACVAAGARWLGVTGVDEGARLRSVLAAPPHPVSPRILVMSSLHAGEADALLHCGLTPVVWEPAHLDLLEAAARRSGLAPGSLPVHLELDTGMARQGLPVPSADPQALGALAALLPRFGAASPLQLEAVMTHFHSPEIAGGGTALQIERLAAALALIARHGLRPGLLHAGNSATLLGGPPQARDRAALEALAAAHGMRLMLRPGLALYGYAPEFSPPQSTAAQLLPVLAWKTRVVSLRTLERGETAGYDATFRAWRPTRLALLPVGYADGYSRLLSNRGHVLIRGDAAPVAGRVSMDQLIVDVSDIPGVTLGDEAVLLGTQSTRSISAEDLARLTGTIPYEILCNISARVPRLPVA